MESLGLSRDEHRAAVTAPLSQAFDDGHRRLKAAEMSDDDIAVLLRLDG